MIIDRKKLKKLNEVVDQTWKIQVACRGVPTPQENLEHKKLPILKLGFVWKCIRPVGFSFYSNFVKCSVYRLFIL